MIELNGVRYVAKPILNVLEIQAQNRALPLNADGHIVSPLCCADAAYRAKLIAWAEDPANVGKVPAWLIHDLSVMRTRHAPRRQT